ncbi:MAG: choice-of-anchor Q domain-containing protein [Candidatus Sedimenticola sp. 4PFRAG1]
MERKKWMTRGVCLKGFVFITTALATLVANAAQFTVNVVDQTGAPVTGFRWLLQEDQTFPVDPNNPAATPDKLLATSFHRSYHPMGKSATAGTGLSGYSDTGSAVVTDVAGDDTDPRNYYVSVMPYSGHSISGAQVAINQPADNGSVTVTVQKHPIPTAQISIFLFHDKHPINAAPDLPQELNPTDPTDPNFVDWSQFTLFLEEPAGRYGQNGGQVIQDAFANPLGTEYDRTCDANGAVDGDPLTNFACIGVDGMPVVTTLGDGTLHPNADGTLLVKNLAPGKYGVIMKPPTGQGWQQTSTIEGSKVVDAWVKANEPPFFTEVGLPGPHVFVGFLKQSADYVAGQAGGFPPLAPPAPGEQTAIVRGTVTDLHMSRPPNLTFHEGRPFPGCWVGLSDAATGAGLYASQCNADSSFAIPDVPAGDYRLVVWDTNQTLIISSNTFTVDPDGHCDGGTVLNCDYGKVMARNWFTRLLTSVFRDDDQDGFRDPGEPGIGPESQDVTLRWRDGTVYQNFPTDGAGEAPFDTVFPFFHWLVAEVSFANKKATGATFVVDAGGPVDTTTDAFPGFGELNPQPQCMDDGTGATVSYDPATNTCPPGSEAINPNTGDNLSWTETGPVLTVGTQGFLGQTSVMQFGKIDYKVYSDPDFTTIPPQEFIGENGGVSGLVLYASTRAEDDPEMAAAETWEPGIPRVQLALYADGDIDCNSLEFPPVAFPNGYCDIDWNGDGARQTDDGIIDDVNGSGAVELADVDNYPLGWADGTGAKGPEDVDRNGNGLFEYGDAIQVTWTDSWDDNIPTGCQGTTFNLHADPLKPTDCFDGIRNFNQVRPAVFDGGYAFDSYDLAQLPAAIAAKIQAFYDRPKVAEVGFEGLIPSDYIVEASTPPGYKPLMEQHKNVDFGDEYTPSLQALPATCVGDLHTVPQYLSQVTKDGSGDAAMLIPGIEAIEAPFAGQDRQLCDRKLVPLSAGQNAATDFFMMTDVPVAANISGAILNDLANGFDPNAPAFGEKQSMKFTPVSFYDAEGNQVSRVYSDEYGRYNTVVPSTITANLPMPSGMSPNMLASCMNDAGPIQNPDYDPNNPDAAPEFIIDPFFDGQYSQFCYSFQYMPGVITYLDTPVVPVSAFTGTGQFALDCEQPDQTPGIASVSRINNPARGPFALPGEAIRIKAMGNNVQVPNPAWDGIDPTQKTVKRNYRFGNLGLNSKAELVAADGTRTPLDNVDWKPWRIQATVPAALAAGDYQVEVTHQNGVKSQMGATLTVGVAADKGLRPNGQTYDVWRVPGDFATIQDAIDNVAAGDMVLVAPGAYDELLIMWKPVKLQGWGAGEVIVNARKTPTEKAIQWRAKIDALIANGDVALLPGQLNEPLGAFPALNNGSLPTEQGAGIFVIGDDAGPNRFARLPNRGARVDGFTIVGASSGGAIVVNGHASDLNIGNNRITSNSGFYNGGIRIGHPELSHAIVDQNDPDFEAGNPNRDVGAIVYDDAHNDRIRIHHNQIVKNGAFSGAGGGIGLHTGADGYKVQNNWVCGNFTQGEGGGIAHFGLSNNGLIEDNHIIFNEIFTQAPGSTNSGGGLVIAGQPGLNPDPVTENLITAGTGNVTVDGNTIRGNLAGAGDGGGISIANVNGEDVRANLGNFRKWYWVNVFNNMITNNVAAYGGAGISLAESLRVNIRNNTVAHNDSVSTAEAAFAPNSPNASTPLPAGILSRAHGAEFSALVDAADIASPLPGDWLSFSDPVLHNDIVYRNRSFYWLNFDNPATPVIETGLIPANCVPAPDGTGCDVATINPDLYTADLGVVEGRILTAHQMDPRFNMLTDTTGYHGSNVVGLPDGFVNGYLNEDQGPALGIPELGLIQTAAAADEGGNAIQVKFGPLTMLDLEVNNGRTQRDYHLAVGSPAIDAGANVGLAGRLGMDVDNDPRVNGGLNDIGADEASIDTDGDGVLDQVDNCRYVPNADQVDTNLDTFGNVCDADFDGDGNTGASDLTIISRYIAYLDGDLVFGALPPAPITPADLDLNGDSVVDGLDVLVWSQFSGQAPGTAPQFTVQ